MSLPLMPKQVAPCRRAVAGLSQPALIRSI